MRFINLLVVGLAPLLNLADAVDAAPAGALAQAPGAHRRSLVDTPDSPWHRRYADSRRQVANDSASSSSSSETPVETPVVADGPPTVITVTTTSTTDSSTSTTSTSTSDTSTSTSDTSTSTSDTSTSTSTSTSSTSTSTSDTSTSTSDTSTSTSDTSTSTSDTSTSTSDTSTSTSDTSTSTSSTPTSDTSSTSTSDGPIIDITVNLPTILPTDTTTTTSSTTTDAPTNTAAEDPSSTSTSVTPTDPPIISISISLPPIFNTTTDEPPPVTDPGTTTTPITTDPITSPDPTPITTSSTSTTSGILSLPDIFPNATIAIPTPTITDEETTTTKPPITIESQYQFITATSFLIAPTTSTTSASGTETDPDAVPTSTSIQSAGASATVTGAAIPSSIPMFITPPISSDHVAPGTTMDGFTEISILFQSTAGWMWILSSSETAAQILAYMPPILYTSLNTASEDVKTIGLSAFEPADTSSPADLMTMWVGLIRTELVSPLSAMIKTPTSEFYKTGDPVAESIAKNVVAAYNIATLNGVSNENGASTSTTSGTTVVDNSRRNAIIGVSTAFGLIALLVFGWWVMKTYRARQEGMHKRLSYGGTTNYGTAGAGVAAGGGGYGGGVGGGYGAGGIRAESPPALHNPFMTEREREEEARGIRRNSFYAIGPDDASIEEETFDYMSQHSGAGGGGSGLNRAGSSGSGGRWVNNGGSLTVPGGNNAGGSPGYGRRPVVGQQISQPILRESSMGNW